MFLQLESNISKNVEDICGPTTVKIDGIRGGSVVFNVTTYMLNGQTAAAAAYTSALKADSSDIFGDAFPVTVDPSSITTVQATNPSKLHCSMLMQEHVFWSLMPCFQTAGKAAWN